MVVWFGLSFLLRFVAFFPGALGRFDDETLLERGRRDADVTDFAAGQQRLHALQIHMEFALGDRGDVRADTAGLLGFTRAPDDAALHRAFAGQFTNACHKFFFRFFLFRAAEPIRESRGDKFFFREILRAFAACQTYLHHLILWSP